MAMKVATKYEQGLIHILGLMGIPVEVITYVFGNNKSFLVNSSQPDSILKNGNNLLA